MKSYKDNGENGSFNDGEIVNAYIDTNFFYNNIYSSNSLDYILDENGVCFVYGNRKTLDEGNYAR